MKYYLGIDGGGTKTMAVLVDSHGVTIGSGIAGPCNIAVQTQSDLEEAILTSLCESLKSAGLPQEIEIARVCAGVAGYTAKVRRIELKTLLSKIFPNSVSMVEPDYVIAHYGASNGKAGVLVNAGTGSVIYGKNSAGRSSRRDGLGYLFGDAGSCFDIGRTALNGICESLLSAVPLTPLENTILRSISVTDLDELIEWSYRDFSTGKLATIAKTVIMEAENGDSDAFVLISAATELLREQTIAVITDLEMPEDNTPIYLAGGLWQSEISKNLFINGSNGNALDVQESFNAPSIGAAKMALDAGKDSN